MTRTLLVSILAGLCSLAAAPASAWEHQRARYAYARVIDAEPIVDWVRLPEQREICHEEAVTRRERRRGSAAAAIWGGIVGGLIGNQFGSGNGRDAMTAAGAALGAASAYEDSRDASAYAVREVCRIETRYVEREDIVGWDVSYRYRGRIWNTTTDNDPGSRIRIRVDEHD